MRLRPEESLENKKNALIAIFIFLLPVVLLVYASIQYLQKLEKKSTANTAQTQEVLSKNAADIEEIRIIQGNQQEIDRTWTLLNGWNQGALSQESAALLTRSGFYEVTPVLTDGATRPTRNNLRTPAQSTKASPYSTILAKSNKTEYLRLLSALHQIEEQEGLTQVQKATLVLPLETRPYGENPTYLDIQMTLATPTSAR